MAGRITDKKYLENGVKISFRTATIGTLAILEEELGYLWGHGKDSNNLTEDEQQMKAQWDIIRERIKNRSFEAQSVFLDNFKQYSIRKMKHFYRGNFQ